MRALRSFVYIMKSKLDKFLRENFSNSKREKKLENWNEDVFMEFILRTKFKTSKKIYDFLNDEKKEYKK